MPRNTPKAPVLGRVATEERISKGERIFADVPEIPRCALEDGRIGAVQRETRADGSTGPMMLALIRTSNDGRESAQRTSLADVQRFADAYKSATGAALLD